LTPFLALSFRFLPLLFAGPGVDSSHGRLDVRYLPGYHLFWIDRLEIFDARIKNQAQTLTLEVVSEKGGGPALQRSFSLRGGGIEQIGVEEAALPDGPFTAQGIVRDKDGQPLLRLQGRLRLEIYNAATPTGRDHRDFTTFAAGDQPFAREMQKWLALPQRVPKPFTPVECVENVVSVWGRDHELSPLGFPAKIHIFQPEPTLQGPWEQVLAGPVRLVLVRGRRRDEIAAAASSIAATGDALRANWSAKGKAKGLAVTLSAVMEYDGVCRYRLTYGPDGPPVVCDGLVLEIPLKSRHATLMHVLSDAVGLEHSGLVPAGIGVVWDSAERVNRKMYGTFRAMAWLGTEDRGVCWFGDSDRGYTLDDQRPTLAIRRDEDQVVLEVRIVNCPSTLRSEKAVEFGLLATPVKPLPQDWRRWIFPQWRGQPGLPHLFEQVELGSSNPPYDLAAMGILPQDWSATALEFKKLRQINAEAIYMEYWCSDILALGHPEMRLWAGEWSRLAHDCFNTRSPRYQGDDQVYCLVQRATPSLQAFRLWAYDQQLARLGPFSFYEDNAQQEVQFDLAKAVGYIRADGKRQPVFDTLACRDYYRRLALRYEARGLRNLSAVHKSYSMLIPAFTHVTVAIDGEQPGQDRVGTDYIDVWKDQMAYFRAHILGRQYGVLPCFLSEIHLHSGEDPQGKATRALLALLLPHDVAIWPGSLQNFAPIRKWWQIMDEFGFGRKPMRFCPYWAAPGHRAAEADVAGVYVTLWQTSEAALLVASNFGEAHDVRIRLDLARLNFAREGGLLVQDAESGETLPATGAEELDLHLPRHDYRLLYLKTAGQDVAAAAHFDGSAALEVAGRQIQPEPGKIGKYSVGLSRLAYVGPPALRYAMPSGWLPQNGSISLWIRPQDWDFADRDGPSPRTSAGAATGKTDTGTAGMYLKVEEFPVGDGKQRDFLQVVVPPAAGQANGFALRLYSVGAEGIVWALFPNALGGGCQIMKSVSADRMADWAAGTWHHVVATWEVAYNRYAFGLFVDGRDWGKSWAELTPRASREPAHLMLLGPAHTGLTGVDEMMIFNRVLRPEEVREIFRSCNARRQ
jgi:hypothetical protein